MGNLRPMGPDNSCFMSKNGCLVDAEKPFSVEALTLNNPRGGRRSILIGNRTLLLVLRPACACCCSADADRPFGYKLRLSAIWLRDSEKTAGPYS
jgi:hypothetical protein